MSYQASQFSLLDVLLIISKRLKLMIYLPLIATIITAIYSLVIPEIYQGKATILPATNSMPGMSLSKLAGFDLSGLGMDAQLTNLYRYQTIIESRTVGVSVINKFNLMDIYKTEKADDCLKALKENLSVDIDEEFGVLSIAFKYPDDPQRAADITNYIIEEMSVINRELSTSLATQQKNFIEKRYLEALGKINQLEDSLKQFQTENDIVLIEEQSKLTLQALAELQVKIVENEITHNLLKSELGENHPKTKAQAAIISELKKQFNKINSGLNTDKFYLAKNNINELAFRFLRIKKDLEINYKIQEFLIPLYEQAKIDVIRDVPDIQILDHATPPDKRISPKRSIMCLIALILTSVLTLAFILFTELYQNLTSGEENHRKANQIRENIKRLLKKSNNA